jgi:hypothetical protein
MLINGTGYIGRLLLNKNPYSTAGFEMQICTLGLGPAFWSAGIYLTLKHEVTILGREYSLIRPEWYPYIFITCDLISLSLQGGGGGIAATAGHDLDMQSVGTNIMMAGIVWQVVTLTTFAVVSVHFFMRIRRVPHAKLTVQAQELWESNKFRLFCWGVAIAFIATYARCVYR